MAIAEEFKLDILSQPNDETCGVTCLHAMYRWLGEELELDELIKEIDTLETGGTLAVILGTHALKKGYQATIYTYNLQVFDPTWFHPGVDMAEKLKEQMQYKKDKQKLIWASNAYLKYLEMGGQIKFEELDEHLLRTFFDRRVPILTGLNATYLYRTPREYGNEYDDVRGFSMGHFVVLYGFNNETQQVLVADPLKSNPISGSNQYAVGVDRLVNAIMLGIVTYDANFLVIEKKEES
jgi:hypothetical protein